MKRNNIKFLKSVCDIIICHDFTKIVQKLKIFKRIK